LPSFALADGHLLFEFAQLKLHSVSCPAVQALAAALAEVESILLMESATIGADSAARAIVRAKTPLKARWSVLHLPVCSQGNSTRIELFLDWKTKVLLTRPLTASV
jgi:hypothetical protein